MSKSATELIGTTENWDASFNAALIQSEQDQSPHVNKAARDHPVGVLIPLLCLAKTPVTLQATFRKVLND
jgi:hypothetical protein